MVGRIAVGDNKHLKRQGGNLGDLGCCWTHQVAKSTTLWW
jgi:hypothetical protein